jgi:hypothetical protein
MFPATANNRQAPHSHVVSCHAARWSGSSSSSPMLPSPVNPEQLAAAGRVRSSARELITKRRQPADCSPARVAA